MDVLTHVVDGDGASDYFWIDDTGKGWGYLNTGKGTNEWYGLGEIAKETTTESRFEWRF